MVSVRERRNSLLAGLLLLFAIESFDKELANDGRWVKAAAAAEEKEEEEEGRGSRVRKRNVLPISPVGEV